MIPNGGFEALTKTRFKRPSGLAEGVILDREFRVQAEFVDHARARAAATTIDSLAGLRPVVIDECVPEREFRTIVRWVGLSEHDADELHAFLATLATQGGVIAWDRVESNRPSL